MENNRVNIYESDDIQNRVSAAMRAMRELKQVQYIGSDSIRFYKRDSGNAFDWSGIPPQSPQASSSSTKVLRVTAVARTQNVLFADIIVEQRLDSPTAVAHTIINYIDEIYTGVNAFNKFSYADAQEPGDENIQSWTVVLDANNPNGTPRPMNAQYMKCYVVANDEVDITVAELN